MTPYYDPVVHCRDQYPFVDERMTKDCATCGTTILVKPARYERTRFCSRECANAGWRGQRRSPGTEFYSGQPARLEYSIGTVTIRTDRSGTRRRWIKLDAGWIEYARWLWEEEHGPLPRGMTVHHQSKDALDDRIGNLVALTRREHIAEHPPRRAVGWHHTAEWRAAQSARMTERWRTRPRPGDGMSYQKLPTPPHGRPRYRDNGPGSPAGHRILGHYVEPQRVAPPETPIDALAREIERDRGKA